MNDGEFINYLHPTERVADIYIKLKSISSKLYNTSASIALIKKALFVEVISKLQNTLACLTINHMQAESGISQGKFLLAILVRIIVP